MTVNVRRVPRPAVLVLVIICCALLLIDRGFGILIGSVLAGIGLSAWAFVYARIMCANESLDWRLLAYTTMWGAVVSPVAFLLYVVLGAAIAVFLIACSALWIASVTPAGHLTGTARKMAAWLERFGSQPVGARLTDLTSRPGHL